MADQSKKDPASAELKKAQRAADGKAAMAEYEAEAAAMRAKTERLRALRLARDAALPPGAKSSAAKSSASKSSTTKSSASRSTAGSKTKSGKKLPSVSLTDWMASQERSGRKT
jgi:hypothetical protein